MSGKHAIYVIVKSKDGQIESKDPGLLNLINRHHCDTTLTVFHKDWNAFCLHHFGYVLEIVDVGYQWSYE
ncbi:hypothetical protein [Polynucleobacter sp.]|uniref:hypothetical protein n=1 Tax=Polynucleobacter sp. TaxID=2029855 RepID=UPI00334028D0